MTTLAATEPEVTRPGWVRCLGGWRWSPEPSIRGQVARTFNARYSWALCRHVRFIDWQIVADPGEETYETPDLAAEACERAQEEVADG